MEADDDILKSIERGEGEMKENQMRKIIGHFLKQRSYCHCIYNGDHVYQIFEWQESCRFVKK